MSVTENLHHSLRKLRLSGVLSTLSLRTEQALADNLSYSEFLLRVLDDELDRRDAKQTESRLRRASFEAAKSVEDFDFTCNFPDLKSRLLELAACGFITRKENVLFLGQTGVGKTHLAQAVGHRACMAGHDVLFTSASDLLANLRAGRADRSVDKRLAKYAACDLLIIDDLGLAPLIDDEPLDLYDVIRRAYEKQSIILTSNRSPEELHALFRDANLATAALDRLLHHAHVFELTGQSYRTRNRPPAHSTDLATRP